MKPQKLWALVDKKTGKIVWCGEHRPTGFEDCRVVRVQVQEVKKKK